MSIVCVLFDLDGVIRHFDDDARQRIERRHGLADGELIATASTPDLLGRLVTGRLTRAAWSAEVGRRVGSPEAAAAWTVDIGTPDPAVLDLVDEIRAGDVLAAILTNGTDTIAAELAILGIDRHVDRVFNTAEIGVAKPDPSVFRHVCEALDVVPESVFFTDDSPRNVEGAAGVGMTAVHYTGVDPLRRDLREAGVDVGSGG